jgi:hypothetical protein
MMRAPSTSLMHGFTVTARELGKLHVHGAAAECKALLLRLGGVRGLATKLSTNLLTGIPDSPDEVNNRIEAYVRCGVCRRSWLCRVVVLLIF